MTKCFDTNQMYSQLGLLEKERENEKKSGVQTLAVSGCPQTAVVRGKGRKIAEGVMDRDRAEN